ncbi:MAG: O-antigen ligase family protein [Candidatus Scalindua sp.]
MLTVSLGTWMRTVFSVMPGVILVIIIALWNPSGQTVRLERPKLPSIKDIISKRNLIFLLPLCFFCGEITFWLTTHFELFTLVGQVILFGSMLFMLSIGMFKPELGPVAFFPLYPFLMFAEARIYGWSWLVRDRPNVSEWLKATFFMLENINVVMLSFAIGFIFFLIRYGDQIRKTMLDKPIIIFLLWTLISVITANDPVEGLRVYFIKWIFPITIYYATFFTVKRINGIREIQVALVTLLFLSCLLTIQNAVLSEGNTATEERAMVISVIGRQTGPLIVLILPLAVSLLYDKTSSIYIRILSLFAIILSFIMVVWEMQRIVFLCGGFMIFLAFLLYPQRRKWYVIFYAIVGIIIFISFERIIMLVEFLRPSLLHENPLAISQNLDRVYLWEKALEIIKDNPFLGIGPGGFLLLQIGYYTPEVSSHNIFLEVALESGIVAAVLFATIYFVPIIKYLVSIIKNNSLEFEQDLRPWIISLMSYCLFLMTSTSWEWGYGIMIFCMLAVVVGTMRKAERKELSV